MGWVAGEQVGITAASAVTGRGGGVVGLVAPFL